MADNVFKRASEKCGLPPIEPIQFDDMVGDPVVPCPPEEIPAAEDPVDVLLPPDGPDCHRFTVNGNSLSDSDFVSYVDGLEAPVSRIKIVQTGCCDFDFQISILLPAPESFSDSSFPDFDCIQIEPGTVTGQMAESGPGGVQLSVSKLDSCLFVIDLNVDFPGIDQYSFSDGFGCIQIEPGEVTHAIADTGPGDVTLTIDKVDDCLFSINLDVQFPSHQEYAGSFSDSLVFFVCPDLHEPSVSWYEGGPGTAALVTFTITKVEDQCAFDFDLFVRFPCPVIEVAEVSYSTGDVTDGFASLEVVAGPDCTFDLYLDILFPRGGGSSCPVLHDPNVSYVWDEDPAVTFDITKDPDSCTFDFDLYVQFPCPTITVEEVNYSVGTDPDGYVALEVLQVGCEFGFYLDITFPPPYANSLSCSCSCPTINAFADWDYWTATSAGEDPEFTLEITRDADTCEFDIDAHITFPCPPMEVGDVTYSFADDDRPFVLFDITPADDDCLFTFDLSIRFPCPTLNDPIATWDYGYDPDVTFTITQVPDTCEFDFDLYVQFPYPADSLSCSCSCPDIEADFDYSYQNAEGAGDPFFELTVTKVDGECAFDIWSYIEFPCPTIEAAGGAGWQSGGNPAFNLVVTPDPDTCLWTITGFVTVPCVDLQQGANVTLAGCTVKVTVGKVTNCTWEIGLEKTGCADDLVIDVFTDKMCGDGGELFRMSRLTIPGATAQDLGWFPYDPCCCDSFSDSSSDSTSSDPGDDVLCNGECPDCPDEVMPKQFTFSTNGFSGNCAALNGNWTVTWIGGCAWQYVSGSVSWTLTRDSGVWTLLGSDSSFPDNSTYSNLIGIAPCCGSSTLSRTGGGAGGCATQPSIVITPVGSCDCGPNNSPGPPSLQLNPGATWAFSVDGWHSDRRRIWPSAGTLYPELDGTWSGKVAGADIKLRREKGTLIMTVEKAGRYAEFTHDTSGIMRFTDGDAGGIISYRLELQP